MHILRTLRNFGFRYTAHRAYQLSLRLPIRGLRNYVNCVSGKSGLEIGGPSNVFNRGGLIPLYGTVGSLDNCNFASDTIWAQHSPGRTFRFSADRAPGYQYVAEGVDLNEIGDGAYEFILSSHMLEHTANPLRALCAWHRVLKPDGALILLVPDMEWTFDHRRPVTTMAHLIEDFERSTGEDDLTHMSEILRLHDLRRDPGVDSFETLRSRCQSNFETRGMHHHVFDVDLVDKLLRHSGFSVAFVRKSFEAHIIALARKVPRTADGINVRPELSGSRSN
jgi:SAM-dependent methyltransferase